MANSPTYYCERCRRTLVAGKFFTTRNTEKYPNGHLSMCKECITAHVDNWDPETYLWILQEIDVPYVRDEWNKVLAVQARNGKKTTGSAILGKYLSRMHLSQYKDFRWKDNEYLQKKAQSDIEAAMKANGFSAAEIDEAIQKATYTLPTGELRPPSLDEYTGEQYEVQTMEEYLDQVRQQEQEEAERERAQINSNQAPSSIETHDFDDTLTDEDKVMLRLKWGRSYTPDEWVYLEQLYNQMMESYDIQTAAHIDTLKLVCKTSLKANQLIDINDIEGYQKMSKVYDTLMKSGRFTASQNKEQGSEFVDSIGELVAVCEKEGFIPRYYIDKPNDKVDETLLDLKNYTHSLVTEEMNLGNLIETSLKIMMQEEAKEEDIDEDEEDLTLDDIDRLRLEDFNNFNDFIEEEIAEDAALFESEDE